MVAIKKSINVWKKETKNHNLDIWNKHRQAWGKSLYVSEQDKWRRNEKEIYDHPTLLLQDRQKGWASLFHSIFFILHSSCGTPIWSQNYLPEDTTRNEVVKQSIWPKAGLGIQFKNDCVIKICLHFIARFHVVKSRRTLFHIG